MGVVGLYMGVGVQGGGEGGTCGLGEGGVMYWKHLKQDIHVVR